MQHQNPEFYGLPLEELGRYLRQQFYAEAERDRLLRQLTRKPCGLAPWRAIASWIAASSRLRLGSNSGAAAAGGPSTCLIRAGE